MVVFVAAFTAVFTDGFITKRSWGGNKCQAIDIQLAMVNHLMGHAAATQDGNRPSIYGVHGQLT